MIWKYYFAYLIAEEMRLKQAESFAHDPQLVAESESEFRAVDLNSRTVSGPTDPVQMHSEPQPEHESTSHLLFGSCCIPTASSWPGNLSEFLEHKGVWEVE